MWEKIKQEELQEGKEYKVMDSQRYVTTATYEGNFFVQVVTKEIVKNPARIWK